MPKGRKGGPRGAVNAPLPMANLCEKHPVSLLGELSAKRKWGAPNYTLVMEQGPAHAKNFIFKVRMSLKSKDRKSYQVLIPNLKFN